MSFHCEHDTLCESRRYPTGCWLCDDLKNPDDDWEFEQSLASDYVFVYRNGTPWDEVETGREGEVEGHDWTEAYYKWKEQQND